MSKGKILVTTRSFRKTQGAHQQILLDAGYEIVNSPYNRPLQASELAELIVGIDAAILGVDDITAEVFDHADRLRVVSRYGIGIDNVDIAAATQKGIVVTNTPGGNTNSVAELTLALMLALARNICLHDRNSRNDDWTLLKGLELSSKTLGILGMGRIGQRVAELAAVFGMSILFYDPYPPELEFLNTVNWKLCDVSEVVTDSDFVSLHLPLMPETQHMIDTELLSHMKNSAFLINTARGGLVNEHALYHALENGTIAGAAVDVLEEEPPKANRLVQLANFITVPHIGSSTGQTTLRMGLMASQNALAVLAGKRPEYVVNPQVYTENGEL